MITTIKLVNASITSQLLFFFVCGEIIKIYYQKILSIWHTSINYSHYAVCISRTYSSYNWEFVSFNQYLFPQIPRVVAEG